MARTIHALQVCRRKLDQHNVRSMRLVATEACRRARNGKDLMRNIRRETGLPLEVIGPEEEARLAVISCAPLVSHKTENLMVVDFAGGSAKLVWSVVEDVELRERPRENMKLSEEFGDP